MEQLTLEQASIYHSENYSPLNREYAKATFKAGAEWQKEQYKPLIEEIQLAMRYLESIGANQFACDLHNELERLQD